MRLTFANQIRILILSMSIGFGLCVLVTFQFLADWQIRQASDRDVKTIASMLRSLIDTNGDMLSTITGVTATNGRFRQLTMTDERTVSEQMPGIVKEIDVDAVQITDRAGVVLGQIGFRAAESQPDKLNELALQGNPQLGLVYRGGDIMIESVHPLWIGSLVQGTLATYTRLGEEGAKRIRGDAGFELAFVHQNEVTAGTLDAASLRVERTGQAYRVDIDGKRYIAQYSPLPLAKPDQDLGFLVLQPEEVVAAPYRTFGWTFLAVLGTVCIVGLAAGSAFARRIVHAVERLVGHTSRLRHGEWPDDLLVTRQDEIGQLETSVNAMATSLRNSQERLLSMIDTDPLTDLDNHRRFKERLGQEAARTGSGETLALLLLDVDRFDDFNSRFGHTSGDEKLREVASAIRRHLPELGAAARYGGDQFAVILPEGSVRDLESVYKLICATVADVTLSAGAAELASARGKADGLVLAAEMALTRAKQLGKGQFCDFGAVPGSEGSDPINLHRLFNDPTYATIRALAAAVDAKDPYTHGHSERVARYASDLAAYLGADALEVDQVHRCGTLHDVGKIGVPDAVLQKPGRLEPEEFRLMQTHSVLGEQIVSRVPQLAELLSGVRHHHERYDGRGYPDGLAGEAIPKIARYLAVADTFDAMTSDRPYRKGLPVETALAEIEANAGTQFDPMLARAFARMMRRSQRVA
jgi:diguanylate cyclase (GGDEF)-like protein